MPTRAHCLASLAAHPRTNPVVAARIRSSLRRLDRRTRLHALASHPGTAPAMASRIRSVLES